MTFAPSAQALISDPEASEAMATTPAAKRVRVEEPKSFRALDVGCMTVKAVDGKEDKYYLPLLDNDTIRFVLTPDGPTKITFGFDVTGNWEQRSFNSTMPIREKSSESLSFRVELGSEQAEFLRKVDEQMKALFCEDATWVPLVVKNDKYEKPTAKVNVCLSGADADLTALKIKRGDVVEKGRGWVFFKMAADQGDSYRVAFLGAEVKIVAKLRAWKMKGQSDSIVRAGITMAATQLFIKPQEREIVEEADVLADW